MQIAEIMKISCFQLKIYIEIAYFYGIPLKTAISLGFLTINKIAKIELLY